MTIAQESGHNVAGDQIIEKTIVNKNGCQGDEFAIVHFRTVDNPIPDIIYNLVSDRRRASVDK